MTLFRTVSLTSLALLMSAGLAVAETYTRGTIKKIDAEAGKVTIIHEELVDLGMPAMTMVFRADEATLAKLAEGSDIEFLADRVKGKLTVTEVK